MVSRDRREKAAQLRLEIGSGQMASQGDRTLPGCGRFALGEIMVRRDPLGHRLPAHHGPRVHLAKLLLHWRRGGLFKAPKQVRFNASISASALILIRASRPAGTKRASAAPESRRR